MHDCVYMLAVCVQNPLGLAFEIVHTEQESIDDVYSTDMHNLVKSMLHKVTLLLPYSLLLLLSVVVVLLLLSSSSSSFC